jgi:hypothetical protein
MGRFFVRFVVVGLAFLAPAAGAFEIALLPAPGPDPAADIILTSEAEVQGAVVAFDWDGSKLVGENLIAGAVAGGDVVIFRVESSYMVLGVVMDADGVGGVRIPAGRQTLATARFRCLSAVAVDAEVELVFQDGKYGSVDLSPRLDNMITVGGLTISRLEGLVLTPGKIVCPGIRPGRLRLGSATADEATGCAPVSVFLDTPLRLEGFVLSVAHDPQALGLREISIAGTATAWTGPDFVSPAIYPDGGTLEVIFDLEPPFLGNTLPPGNGQTIAHYIYCCRGELQPGDPDSVTPLRFVDGVFGDPPRKNWFVVNGQRVAPDELLPGSFTCPAPRGDREFRCGSAIDPVTGKPLPIVGAPGSTVAVCFFYRSVPHGAPGESREDRIQGLSMAVCYDPEQVRCVEGTFDISGTVVQAVGAEFVNHHCENDADDGDPGELVIGILVDADPPFDGRTLPPGLDLQKIGCVNFAIDPGATCGSCNEVSFCNGANGNGKVPIKNLLSIDNQSVKPVLFDCDICVGGTPAFRRGDCNDSPRGAMSVEIADAAAILGFLFHDGSFRFEPPCLDACDANDDGKVDTADAVYVLRYLFQHGSRPPDPGPNVPGPDPTADGLDCRILTACP